MYMKKILILTLWFDWWWSWKIAAILENFLNKSYETVTLVFFKDTWVFKLKWKKINIPSLLLKHPFPWRWYIELMLHIIKTIKYVKKEKPDIVIWAWSYCNVLWLIAKKFFKFKLLLTQHEHITSRKNNTSRFSIYNMVFLVTKKLILNNKIVCVSNTVRSDTIKYYWIKEDQAQTIYNWLDFDEILRLWKEQINIKDKYIINIWNLSINKNQELLIKAYNKSKIKNTYKLLLLWWEWGRELYLKELCRELKIEKSVIFAWFDKNPYKYLCKASLFCSTSLTEALPTVLIESLILNIPIISTPVSWADEILDNWKFWIITNDWNEQNLIKELDSFKGDWVKYNVKEKNNFISENFSIEEMEKKYLKIIKEL